MSELQVMEARLARLERENRRMKRVGTIACGVLGILGLVAAASPVCDVLYGERLVLRDEGGRARVTIDAYRTEQPSLAFQDREGRAVARLGVDKNGDAYLATYDAKGGVRGNWAFTPQSQSSTPEAKPAGEKKNDPAIAGE